VNFNTEEHGLNMTIFWTWDSRHGGKMQLVRLWITVVGMTTLAADSNNGITVTVDNCEL
jgi:hypothetical protein